MGVTSFMKGINNALDTNPGTSFDVVTSIVPSVNERCIHGQNHTPFPHAIANERALSSVSGVVCRAEISSTSFWSRSATRETMKDRNVLTMTGTGLKK